MHTITVGALTINQDALENRELRRKIDNLRAAIELQRLADDNDLAPWDDREGGDFMTREIAAMERDAIRVAARIRPVTGTLSPSYAPVSEGVPMPPGRYTAVMDRAADTEQIEFDDLPPRPAPATESIWSYLYGVFAGLLGASLVACVIGIVAAWILAHPGGL